MFVGAKQFEFILPGKLCQTMDFFDTGKIRCNLTPRGKVGEILALLGSEFKIMPVFTT